MSSLLSPGISVTEKDFSTIVPTVPSSIGGIAGRFTQGPLLTPILVSSETELVKYFGEPTDLNANEWFTAAQFLQYTNSLWVVRAANAGLFNACTTGVSSIAVFNIDGYESFSSNSTAGQFIAKNPGTAGNGIGVIIVDSNTYANFVTWSTTNASLFPDNVPLSNYFNGAPSSTPYMDSLTPYMDSLTGDSTLKADEVFVMVLDVTGNITGTPYTVLEQWQGLSKGIDAVDYKGLTVYYANVINNASQYIWWSQSPTASTGASIVPFGGTCLAAAATGFSFSLITPGSAPSFTYQVLAGGVNGTAATQAQIQTAYDKLANKDLYSVDLLMCGAFGFGNAAIEQYVLNNVAYLRGDCVAFMSPHTSGAPIRDSSTAVTTIAAFKAYVAVLDNIASYGFMDTGMKYIYDRYSYKYRWVPLNGDIAGLAARTDSTNDAWWSFAGYNRGGILNVIKFAYNPSQADRDYLYPRGINPVIMDPNSGPILFGDRTMTVKPSAFDHINVRRLFLVLEASISKAAKYSLFEFNDSFTQALFVNMVTPFLKSVQGKRGITTFQVTCDASNNTPQVVDANQFVADIFIIPSKSINYIKLSFVATQTGVQFSTVTGA